MTRAFSQTQWTASEKPKAMTEKDDLPSHSGLRKPCFLKSDARPQHPISTRVKVGVSPYRDPSGENLRRRTSSSVISSGGASCDSGIFPIFNLSSNRRKEYSSSPNTVLQDTVVKGREPHQLGLGCTRSPARPARATAIENLPYRLSFAIVTSPPT